MTRSLFALSIFCLLVGQSELLGQSSDFTSAETESIVPSERSCFAHEKHVQMMGLQKYAAEAERIEQHTAQWAPIVAQQRAANQNAVVTIPVVFHVVYRTATENISAEQIQSQLDVLNDDFRRLNSDVDDIWPQAADTEIEFCLASFDPQGNPSDGILRVPTTVNGFGTNDAVKSASSGGSDAWPYNEYLNFWVCNIGGGILGYAQFPGGSAGTDGVVCGYQYTGTVGTATSPFDLGRTATHEVGHWLNLRHIWGDGGCGASDFVDDTPDSDGPNYGCALGNVACNTTDMVQNYMDYSDDACMNLFTQGQTDRMLALFQPGGFRAGLLTSNGCAPPCEVSCGCTDDTACNFDSNALNDDGTCDFSCYGCTNAAACNYDPSATLDDGSCATGELQDFTFNLTPDNYGSETTWTLVDDGGATVMSGGPYVNSNSTPVSVSANLGAGCYTLTVNDSYGDGICCQYGAGEYSLTVCGEVVASGATFTTTDVSNFCVEPTNVSGCTDSNACNFNPAATTDDGSCLTEDACGICGGPGAIYDCGCSDIPTGDCDCNGNQIDECGECGGGGIPAGDCDCNGNQLDALDVCGGSCTADADSDGICDDVDTCVGTLDECGVCNGPGIPAGDCDCNGNQLDALNVCGGSCTADADSDGICDNVDDCVGIVDECGVCNGAGIPAGDCDCNGNQLDALDVCGGNCTADADSDGICDDVDDCVGTEDALGVCNGDCAADADQDGICDDVDDCVGQLDALGVCNGDCAADVDEDGICDTDEVPGCDNETACNYDVTATDNDGSCVFVGDACNDGNAQTLGDVYTNCALPNFGCQGVGPEIIWKETFGDEPSINYGWNGSSNTAANETEWSITFGSTTDYFYTLLANDGDTLFRGRDTDVNCTWTTRNIDISTFTELKLSAEFSEIGGLENADFVRVDAIVDGQTTELVNLFNDFNTVLVDLVDVPDGDNIQIQITVRTDRNGEYISFDDVYLYGTPNCTDSDGDGLCDEDDNCSDLSACNFSDPSASECLFNDITGVCGGDCTTDADQDGICDDVDPCIGAVDACGICNGPGDIYDCGCSDIPAGDCDCDGNQEDVLGVCGGDCTADADQDGICDDVDDCVGTPDACGVCNGPGEVFECGCADIPDTDCDCDGNQLDALGVCGGTCAADADQDGICDDVDDCVGSLDACGVCNGPGEVFDCGCSDIPEGDCDCDGNQDDAIGDCGGDCTADADEDGVCDDVDPCVGTLDVCGICNGPGDIYDCGCSDIPAGDCDCDGNQLDAIDVCGGDCAADADQDGICDDVDDCVGSLDACGVCNGPGEIYTCGCADIPATDCDCDGNQLDALGVCGGTCAADADQDGICDDVDDCVGSLDACGVCNGPGEVFDCGCSDIPEGDCDCDGNQLDAIDECGGDCTADADQDGICDDVDDCVGDL
ncbi:M43 family zinc metalloprotease, partial [Flavobacteriales bacterium]|nr:M43 family zinc metalloprotease [Flavobacteriales bacterium]